MLKILRFSESERGRKRAAKDRERGTQHEELNATKQMC
jgi:hypothetical protein